ncbi:hypothetical protein DL764_004296 [Monosporascus ibericus]|uniref:Uncharacterized protein n=1 Tax=Monosporascus ibericus TaxID=155417 RepID=A0A4Q4TGM1_9PEZI|nr:hypothetical protein DL764_004296 [Monosporascus ibericus]
MKMRLRRSNQGKRFRPSDFNLRLSLSDEEEAVVSEGDHASLDEGFVDDGEPEPDAEDGIEDDDLVESSGVEAPEKKIKKPKTKRVKRPEPTDQGSISSLGVVQEYPTDPSAKWTRSYVGPVKRWTRLQLLTKFWFGDRENYLDIVGEFVRLWWEHQILPPKLVSKHDLRVASHPWMPDDFPEDQENKFRQLYEKYLAKRTNGPTTFPINKDKAFGRFLPHADDDLTVILGHVADQEEHYFKRGQNMSFSGLGNPIRETDDGRTKSSGWLLDVAGIVVSMAWAPSNCRTHQLLAMAVVPFSDQAFYQDPKKAMQESEKKEGSVQIWRFEADEDNRGLVRPASRPPTLMRALCFSWGRASRLQWSPVPLTSNDRIGLLAVLCGDGNLRVLEIMSTAQSSEGTFGKHFIMTPTEAVADMWQRRYKRQWPL